MAGTRGERPASTAAARRLKTIDVETTSFFDALWPALAAGVIAGLVVLGVGYLLIEKRLRLHERAENERQTRKAFLQIVLAELLHNAGHLTTFVEELPEMLVPAPGFELGGWALVSQERALLTIREETASKLLHAYGRMRSANDLRDQLVDLINGTSALTVRIADASARLPDGTHDSEMAKVIEEFEAHKVSIRDGLLRRLNDLKPFLDDAIDAVDAELEISFPVKAAGRLFRHTTPPDRL